MVDLENPQQRGGIGVAVGEGIKSCAQDDVLPYASRERLRQRILGKPAARHDECAQMARETQLQAARPGENFGGSV